MTKETRKPFHKLTLMDDFLFSAASEDINFCKCMLQAILGKRIIGIKGDRLRRNIRICRNEAVSIKVCLTGRF